LHGAFSRGLGSSGVAEIGHVLTAVGNGTLLQVMRMHVMDNVRQRIEAAKQRLESLSGEHVGQAELYAVIEILEGKT
jgi:hypothetical protein